MYFRTFPGATALGDLGRSRGLASVAPNGLGFPNDLCETIGGNGSEAAGPAQIAAFDGSL